MGRRRRRIYRRVGVVNPLVLDGPPDSLASNASAATNTWRQLWWRTSNSLCLSSGARLLVDLQAELGIAPAFAQSFWARDLIERLDIAVRAFSSGFARPPLPTSSATTVDRQWLALAIWYTYHRAELPDFAAARIELPPTLTLARLGTEGAIAGYSPSVQNTRCLAGFTRELPLRAVPVEGGEFVITGAGPRPRAEGRGIGTGALVVGALILAALAAGGGAAAATAGARAARAG